MGGWRRYLELQAQAKTGLSSGLFVWALLAVVFGVLIERTGRYELPLFISAALLLVGALCALRIDPTLHVQTLPFADSKVPV